MTYHAYKGLGAQIVEQTLNTLVQHSPKTHFSDAIIAALKHLRFTVGSTQGEVGLRRFDSNILYTFNKYKSEPKKLELKVNAGSSQMSVHNDPERIKAILVDTVENCLLLNARGQITSTDVLIDILTSYLIALNGDEASLGDLLSEVNNYNKIPSNGSALWQTLSLH